MRVCKSAAIGLVAACGLAGSGFAQDLEVTGERIDPKGFPGVTNPYESRILGYVYDNLSQTFGQSPTRWGSVANGRHWIEDISFNPGPWANVGTRLMDQMTWGTRRAAGGPYDADVFFRFWDKDDVSFAGFLGEGTAMVNAGATPLAEFTVELRGVVVAAASANQTTTSLAGLPGGGVTVPDDGFYLEVICRDAGTTNVLSNDNLRLVVATNSALAAPANPATVGLTSIDLGFDATNDGAILGSATVSATGERRTYVLNTPTRSTGYMVRFRGDIPPPPPPANIDLGCLLDGTTTETLTLADGTAQWYHFCLNADATDPVLAFLDADTEGSAADLSVALFNSDGQVVSSNTDDGSGTAGQLSFGVGRRAAVGDGAQYDGRHGQLASGDYYVVIAPAGSTFGDGFTANATGVGGGATLNLNTNVNGAPLAPTVVPVINHVDYGSPITFPDARPGTAVNTGLRGVLWSTFETDAEAGSGNAYLDIEFSGLTSASSDAVAYVFDANGNIVAFSDDEGEGARPQFSFGAGDGPRTYGANPEPFTGANGSLPAGRYYLAIALFATQDLLATLGDDRFHVRATSGSNWGVGADIFTGGSAGPACDPDVNQDGNVDQDDVSYLINVVGGGDNPTGIDPDFNQDGNVDQDDIAALINTVGGGGCP